MRVNVTQALNNLTGAKQLWEQALPSLPQPDNLQGLGVSTNDISRAFDEVAALLNTVNEHEIDGPAWLTYKANIESLPTNLFNLFTQSVGNPQNIISNTQNICSWLWSFKSSLLQIVPLNPEVERFSEDFAREMTAKIETTKEWFRKSESIKEDILKIESSARAAMTEISTQQTEAGSTLKTIQDLLTSIQAHEREAGTAKTNAGSAATAATTDANTVAKAVQELSAAIAEKNTLFSEFEAHRVRIEGLLENANKVGLARSFQDKRKELAWTWRAWAMLFFAGIASLASLGWFELIPLLKAGTPDPVAVAVRFLVAGPLVWFTWFAARQYGHVLRISEDYAFKEAAAMSFAGYRDEMGGDQELLKMLQESAIRNFGANPAEMLLKKSDAASPVHAVVEKVLEKVNPKELLASILAAVKK